MAVWLFESIAPTKKKSHFRGQKLLLWELFWCSKSQKKISFWNLTSTLTFLQPDLATRKRYGYILFSFYPAIFCPCVISKWWYSPSLWCPKSPKYGGNPPREKSVYLSGQNVCHVLGNLSVRYRNLLHDFLKFVTQSFLPAALIIWLPFQNRQGSCQDVSYSAERVKRIKDFFVFQRFARSELIFKKLFFCAGV